MSEVAHVIIILHVAKNIEKVCIRTSYLSL